MFVRKIAWLGMRTDRPEAMVDLMGTVLGIPFSQVGDEQFWVFQLPDGSKVEVFGPRSHNPHFTTGPVPGFLVDDVDAATDELRSAGIHIEYGPIHADGEDRGAWVHFRGPDGNIYELTQGPDAEGQSAKDNPSRLPTPTSVPAAPREVE